MSNGGGPKAGLSSESSLSDLQAAWRERETEARTLISSHRSTAIALRFYALEIKLKTLVCKKLNLDYLPNHCRTHDLTEVILFTGLSNRIDNTVNPVLSGNWDLLVKFSKARLNNLRYLPGATLGDAECDMILNALDDPGEGVWTWLLSLP